MELKRATPKDLPAIAEMEKTFAFPLSEEELARLLQNEVFHVLTWKNESEILGHCVLFRAADEAEITSLTVRKDQRGQGIGTAFLKSLLEYIKADGAKIAFLDVRESNIAARKLYKNCGFSELGRRRRFYQKPVEDAIGMGIEL